jgi:hypothetical protein
MSALHIPLSPAAVGSEENRAVSKWALARSNSSVIQQAVFEMLIQLADLIRD